MKQVAGSGLGRRERQRQQTLTDIVSVSRQILASGQELSLRGIAAELGMTAPAMYRYVDNHAALLEMVGQGIFAEMLTRMQARRQVYAADDPAAAIAATTVAFRCWALRHPHEFRLLFASGPAENRVEHRHPSDQPCDEECLAQCVAPNGSDAFMMLFGDLFAAVIAKYRDTLPPLQLDEQTRTALRHVKFAIPEGFDGNFGGLAGSPENAMQLMWLFEMSWARLYGVVALEVFGHIHAALSESGAVFVETLRGMSKDLGMEGDWEHIADVIRQELRHECQTARKMPVDSRKPRG